MCYLLCIETSTEVCSVALAKENQLVAVKNHQGNAHAEQLMPFVDSIVNEAGINVKQLDAVAVSEGGFLYRTSYRSIDRQGLMLCPEQTFD